MAKIKQIKGKDYIFCDWRRKYVRLTPEEWTRQQFLHHLVEELHYPSALIGVEIPLIGKRADAIVYAQDMHPLALVEFKREDVALDQAVLDQVAVYNRQLSVPWLILHNGPETVVAQVHAHTVTFIDYIPTWTQLSN